VEFEPPLACVRRILKNSLPSSNVGKDASAAFARACGIFVIYVTACANDFARENKRQTITANDVLAAVKVSKQRQRFLRSGICKEDIFYVGIGIQCTVCSTLGVMARVHTRNPPCPNGNLGT
jgi:histone H3/H4